MTQEEYEDRYSDPWGGEAEDAEIGEVLGTELDPESLPEDALEQGRRFAFSGDVADSFEELVIPRQIPGYKQMRFRCLHVAKEFVTPDSDVLDLGTSRGKMIRDLIAAFVQVGEPDKIDRVTYIGVDSEPDMLSLARKTVNSLFETFGSSEEMAERAVKFMDWDLRKGLPPGKTNRGYSVVSSVLTLQFIPMEHRARIVSEIYEQLNPGGAFILVEKVLGNSLLTDDLLTKIYYDDKARNGISEDAIIKKRESLEGFLVPQRSEENRYLLEQAGFRRTRIDTFWRDLQFEAVLAVK